MPVSLPGPALELAAASARYDERRPGPEAALAQVSFTLEAGELCAIVGPNGAGKSTLLRVLAGTLAPTEGTARLFGRDLSTIPRREVARSLAFVPQSEDIRFAFTVRDVVRMGRAPHQDGWLRPSAHDEQVVEDVLGRSDLLTIAHRAIDELSGGEKKRVAIARALAQRAPILLLDEPTAFLDVRHQVALFAALHEAARSTNVATVVVTHDLQLAAAHASRVVLLKGGRVLADGSVDDVLTRARLEATFDCRVDVGRLDGSGARVFVPVTAPTSVDAGRAR